MARGLKEKEKIVEKQAREAAKEQAKREAEETRKAKEAEAQAEKQAEAAALSKKKQEAKDAKKLAKAQKLEHKRLAKALKKANKGPGLFAKKAASLYIEDDSIKLLVTKGKHVISFAESSLEPGLVSEGVINQPASVADKIRSHIHDHKIDSKKIIVGLSGLHCISRLVTLPRLSGSMLTEAVRREAERELPVSMDNVYLAYKVVGTLENELKVFIIAYNKNVVDTTVETLILAKVKPRIMDLSPLALARVANKRTALITDVRDGQLDIVMMIEGVPELIRTLPLPRDVSLEDKLPIIRDELERTIKFYEITDLRKSSDESLPVFVYGELTDKAELLQTLQSGIGHPITSPLPPLRYPSSLITSRYIVNVGLVLKSFVATKEYGLNKANLNALPEQYRKTPSTALLIGIPVGVIAVVWLVYIAMQIQSAGAEIDSLRVSMEQAKSAALQKQTQQQSLNTSITGLQKSLTDSNLTLDTYTQASGEIGQQQHMVNTDIPLVSAALPDNMSLTGVDYSDKFVRISGGSPDKLSVLIYAQNLKNSGLYSQTEVTKITYQEKTEDFNFTITLKK